jgi:hypothetical protein
LQLIFQVDVIGRLVLRGDEPDSKSSEYGQDREGWKIKRLPLIKIGGVEISP